MITVNDFDFLAWADQTMTFPGDMLEALTSKCGVAQDVALTLAYAGAIQEKHCLLALYQDYCQTPGPERDAFSAYLTYAFGCYQALQVPKTMLYVDTFRGLPIGSLTNVKDQGWRFIPFTTAHQPSRRFWADMESCIPTWALARRGTLMTKEAFNHQFPHHALK